MPRKSPPAKKASPAKAPAKKAPAKQAAPPAPPPADEGVELEVRLAGKIVFLQAVDKASYSLTFRGGNLSIKANTSDAVAQEEEAQLVQLSPEDIAALTPAQEGDEVDETDPRVHLGVHSGDRNVEEG